MLRALTIPVLISDVETRLVKLSTFICFAVKVFGSESLERKDCEIDQLARENEGQP